MLIISKFKDYYDSAVGHGVDKTIVYKRDWIRKFDKDPRSSTSENQKQWEEYLAGKTWYHPHRTKHRSYVEKGYGHNRKGTFEHFVIGFCGKLYPGVILDNKDYKGIENAFYDKDKLIKAVKDKHDLTEDEVDLSAPFGFKHNSWGEYRWDRSRGDWFNEKDHSGLLSIFEEYKTPCFIKWNQCVDINPELKEFKFQQVMDPYTTFQEIMMYISGVLGVNEVEVVTLSDKDKLHKKGFDDWSFKKLPGGKKRKKKK